jgi:hypothetical protein
MSMGFSNIQARLSLRVSGGHVEKAVEYIIKVINQIALVVPSAFHFKSFSNKRKKNAKKKPSSNEKMKPI